MMRHWTRLVLLLTLVGALLAVPWPRGVKIKADAFYFPDQVEYIRASRGKCAAAEQVYWPGDGRCYTEGTRGPCTFESRLVWDDHQLRPRCERDNSLFG